MSYSYELIGSVVDRLNSNLQDPYNGTRTGSWVFGPDKELNFNRYMPKIHVNIDTEPTREKSFGNDFRRTKDTTIVVFFYTKQNDIGSYSQLKNRELVLYVLGKIEEDLKTYTMNNFSLLGVGEIGTPDYSSEHSTHFGVIPLVYVRRET